MSGKQDNILNYNCDIILQSQRGSVKHTYIVPANTTRSQELKKISDNKNSVQQIIRNYQNKKLIKNCSKLCISKGFNGGFYPDCKDSSLEWITTKASDRYNQYTEKYLNSCGINCVYFEHEYIGKMKKSCSSLKNFFIAIFKMIRNFYNKQPTTIKILIWFAVAGAVAPNIVNTAIEMYIKISKFDKA